jgi:hypothetical protein
LTPSDRRKMLAPDPKSTKVKLRCHRQDRVSNGRKVTASGIGADAQRLVALSQTLPVGVGQVDVLGRLESERLALGVEHGDYRRGVEAVDGDAGQVRHFGAEVLHERQTS